MNIRILVRDGQSFFYKNGNYDIVYNRNNDVYEICKGHIVVGIFPKRNILGIIVNNEGEGR